MNDTALNSEECLVQLKDDSNEKTDSGMDEDSTENTPDMGSEDEDVIGRTVKKKKIILDDEDDDDDDVEEEYTEKTKDDDDGKKNPEVIGKLKTLSEALDAVLDSDSDGDDPVVGKILDSDDDGDDDDVKQNTIKRKKKRTEITNEENSEMGTTSADIAEKPKLFDSDLYDAEDSDVEDADKVSNGSPVPSDNEIDDEGIEDDIDPQLKAKLKKMKGAARKPKERKDRKAKPKRDDLLGLHSETQRLIRESSVTIPYHHPEPKSLDDFLARVSKKQQEYKALRGAKEFKKPHVIQHMLASITPDELPRLNKSKVKKDSNSSQRQKASGNTLESNNNDNNTAHTDSDNMLSSKKSSDKTLECSSPTDNKIDSAKRTLHYDTDDDDDNDDLPNISESSKTDSGTSTMHYHIDNFKGMNEKMEKESCFSDSDEVGNKQKSESLEEENKSSSVDEKGTLTSLSESVDNFSLVLRMDSECSDKDNVNERDTQDELSQISTENNDSEMCGENCDTDSEKNKDNINKQANSNMTEAETNMENDSFKMLNNDIKNKLNNMDIEMDSNFKTNLNSGNENSVEKEKTEMNLRDDATEEMFKTNSENKNCENADNADIEMNSDSENCESKSPEEDSVNHPNSGVKKISRILPDFTDVKPRLSGGPSSFINLDENKSETPKNPGIVKLIDRFLQHSKKKTLKSKMDVDISVVQKENISDSKDDLKMTSFTYHLNDGHDEEDEKLDTPGAKLLKLKEHLKVQIKLKREEARQKRVELYELENEEGFEEEVDDEEAILDDEEELSEKTDTDVEDDDFEEQFGNEEIEEEEKEKNPFVDAEAEEDDDDEELENDDDDEQNDLPASIKLRLDSSDDDDENEKECLVKKKKPKKLTISDDEESHQSEPSRKEEIAKTTPESSDESRPFSSVAQKHHSDDSFNGLSPMSKHLSDTQTQIPRKMSSLTLPIEDSQDLYDDSQSSSHNMTGLPTKANQSNDSFNFLTDDSQSQMLDADGFLKVHTSLRKPTKQSLNFIEDTTHISGTQNNMDELLGLCSGKFVETQENSKKESCKNLFGDNQKTKEIGDMDELLGLCSGFFPASCPSSNKIVSAVGVTHNEEEQSNASFSLLSDGEDNVESEKELSDDDDDNSNDDDDNLSDDLKETEIIEKKKHFKGFVAMKTKKIKQAFVEDEAELSGSEYDSDENLDIPEEEDIMEMEEGDLDNSISEEELREQVGRVHLKRTIDEDKRDIMRLQEMYLPDGDLYSDGKGRMRRFKWSNQDDKSQEDMFGTGSDEEGPDEENADELKWRIERFEREKFLEEQKEKEEQENEDSQLLKFGKMFLQRQVSTERKETEFKKPQQPGKSPVKVLHPRISKKGSFLNRSKAALAQISARSKMTANPSGPTNSKNFIFHVVSPEKIQEKSDPVSTNPLKKRKAHVQNPSAKRPKKDSTPVIKQIKSIFNLLEK